MSENKKVPASLRNLVKKRAKAFCEYCCTSEDFSSQSFSIEHILPRALGGATSAENLAYSCQGCNNHKATKTSALDYVTEKDVKLYNPRTDVWLEHFVWSEDCTEIIGLTATGRATVTALRLNREGLTNLRRVLYQSGEHPPKEL